MSGYECSLCDGTEQATILITPLTGGDTMAVGQGCMATAFTGMLAGTLGLDAEELGKAVDRLTKARDRKAAAEATGDHKAAEAEGQDHGPDLPSAAGAGDPGPGQDATGAGGRHRAAKDAGEQVPA